MNRARPLGALAAAAAAAALVLGNGGCFDPTFDNPTCGPSGECPSGTSCVQNVCRAGGGDTDAMIDMADATDAMPIDMPGDGTVNDGTPGDGPMCPTGDITSPSDPHRCFVKIQTSAPWMQQRANCQTIATDLADILTMSENAALMPFYQGENQGVWLGGSDMSIEMDWRWVRTGTPLPFFQWGTGEPNDSPAPGDCMRIDGGGLWFDTYCSETRRAICVRLI